MLAAAEVQGAEVVVIDTGPSADSAALAAARAADIILVPAKCTIRDLKALGPTIRSIADAVPGKRLVVVLSMVPVNGSVTREAVRYLAAANIEVCPVRFHQRAAYYNGTRSRSVVGGMGAGGEGRWRGKSAMGVGVLTDGHGSARAFEHT